METSLPGLKRLLRIFVWPLAISAALISLFLFSPTPPTEADLCSDYFDCNAKIEDTKKKINELVNQADSLAKQISYLEYQIYLSQLEIESAEQEIAALSIDIGDLSQRLGRIVAFLEYQQETFTARARSAYIADRVSSVDVALGSDTLDDAMHRIKYLKILEEQDREVLEQMQDTRGDYENKKAMLESKKADVEQLKRSVEAHKANLANQQASKEQLLAVTKGEEAQYRQYLSALEAERASILAALRQGGTLIGDVPAAGVRIARQGNTGCTSWPGGYHIHYEVRSSSNAILNPCGFVNVVGGVCSSGSYASWGGRVVNGLFASPGGSWNVLTQSYWAGHLALDIVSYDGWVYSSAPGTAYLLQDNSWCSWCWTGKPCTGPAYGIVIDHHNGYKTLYWHIQP
jgi:peptidoglycan hydrolase CwlO-like protein